MAAGGATVAVRWWPVTMDDGRVAVLMQVLPGPLVVVDPLCPDGDD